MVGIQFSELQRTVAFYAPNFEEVGGANYFLVVYHFVCHAFLVSKIS